MTVGCREQQTSFEVSQELSKNWLELYLSYICVGDSVWFHAYKMMRDGRKAGRVHSTASLLIGAVGWLFWPSFWAKLAASIECISYIGEGLEYVYIYIRVRRQSGFPTFIYPANAKTPTCCPSDDNRTKVTNSVTSARSLWWHVGPYFWPADLTRTASPIHLPEGSEFSAYFVIAKVMPASSCEHKAKCNDLLLFSSITR